MTPSATAPTFAGSGQRLKAQREPSTFRSIPGRSARSVRSSAAGASLIPGVAIEDLLRGSAGSTLQAAGNCDELLRLDKRGVDECLQGPLDRTTAEPIEDALHCVRRRAVGRFLRAVDERPGLDRVRDVAFFFEAPEHGTDGGVLELSRDVLSHVRRGHFAAVPEDGEDLVLEIA